MANITLRRHLTEAVLDPDLIYLIEDIASLCRVVANTVRNGAFEGNLGSADAINIQGETQKTLDILAFDIGLSHLIHAAIELYPHIPMCMHQDHSNSPATCMSRITNGVSSVMMDGSLEADGKILALQTLTEIHVKIPNAHLAMYSSSSVPQELQDKINAYGGEIAPTWGVPFKEVKLGIKHGVRKVNIDTDLRIALTGGIREVFAKNPSEFDQRKYLAPGVAAMSVVCKGRFERFGAAGMASKIATVPLAQMAQPYAASHLVRAS